MPTAKYRLLRTIYAEQRIKISDLIKEARVSQQSAYKYLNDLLAAGVIREEITGRKPSLRQFSPETGTEAGQLCYALVEAQRTLEFFSRHPKLKGPFAQFGNELRGKVDTSLVFGSFARGTETADSDIDILVLGNLPRRTLDRVSENCFITLKNRASIRLMRTEAFSRALKAKDAFALQIMKDHIVIANAAGWARIIAEMEK